MDSVSCIVVTHNSAKYIGPCLKSILASKGVLLDKVVVVDNASSDATVKIVKGIARKDDRVRLIRLKRNLGFPLACNIGVMYARGEHVAFVNPDVIVDRYCFARLVEPLGHDRLVAVVQPKLLHPSSLIDGAGGLMDILGHGFHVGKYERDKGQYNEPRDILYACFACAVVRKDVFIRLGGLDPHYFLYNEDLDFCWRCWLAGYRVVYVPHAVAWHVGEHSTRKVPYHALYFGRRNRLFTVFSNYSLPLALLFGGMLMLLYAIAIPYVLLRGDSDEARVLVRVLTSTVRYRKYLAYRRRLVSRIRRVSDFALISRGLIVLRLDGIALFISGFYRRQLSIEEKSLKRFHLSRKACNDEGF